MKLSRQQLEALYRHMNEVAENTHGHEYLARKSIRGTNWVIAIFTGIGAILVTLILSYFIFLNQAISHSIESMSVINKQVVELRHTMGDITSSIANMGNNVEYLQRISGSINNMNQTTEKMTAYMKQVEQQTKILGSQANSLALHATVIDQNFSQVNLSVGNISYSVHQAVKPIKQFIPMP